MEWAGLILQIAFAVGQEIYKAVTANDMSVFDKPVRDLIPKELQVTLARKRAEAAADAKFGTAVTPPAPPPELPPNPFDRDDS